MQHLLDNPPEDFLLKLKDKEPVRLVLDGFLRREQLAQQLDCSPRTLDRWHNLRIGPPRVCVGRMVLYDVKSVREWLRSHEQQMSLAIRRLGRNAKQKKLRRTRAIHELEPAPMKQQSTVEQSRNCSY